MMRTIGFIIQKEFKQIFRNKGMIPLIFILPLIQLLILSNAATFEVKNISFSYVDADKTAYSRALIDKFEASKYFNVVANFPSSKIAKDAMQKGEVNVILQIPQHFERSVIKDKKGSLSVIINAIDGAAAGVENVYVSEIIKSYNQSIQIALLPTSGIKQLPKRIETVTSFWFNPELNYKTFMVPGILVLLITMITLFLSGMNIVREKEIGTLEQINVTPIKKHQFIIGKLFPFWVIGLFELTIGLIVGKVLFAVPMVGSIGLIYLFAAIYLLVLLGMVFFISNFTDTQQQAMFISWFFVVIFILMSGLFTPIESMPEWAQYLTEFNPIKFFVEVMRMVMLKGAGFSDIIPQFIKIIIYAVLMNLLAVVSYKKVT